jgi:membrane protease subunit (stomatin/prohibitin family)
MNVLISDVTVIIIAIVILIIFAIAIILWLGRKKTPGVTTPLPLSDDIYVQIKESEFKENQNLIVGNDQTLIVLVNENIQHTEENYLIECNDILPFIQSKVSGNRTIEDNKVVNFVRVYRVTRNLIENVDFAFSSPIQYLDPLYNIMVKLKLSLQISFQIYDIGSFMTYFERNTGRMSKKSFKYEMSGFIEAKLYGVVSSFITSNKMSYLHTSLHMYEIEQELIEEMNRFLSKFGLDVKKLIFTNIENNQDSKFLKFSSNILEKSRMDILGYTYTEKMNNDLSIIEEELKAEKEESEEVVKKVKGIRALFK